MTALLPAAALALALAAAPPARPGAPAPSAGVVEVFEDDYPAALAAARARDVPILVDVWAPW